MKKRAPAKRPKGKPSAKSKGKAPRSATRSPARRGGDDVEGFIFSPLLSATPRAIDVYATPRLSVY